VIGDKLLVAIAERLSSCIRPGDVVARLGGDEFTILLNRTGGVEDVARVAERLQKKLSEPFRLNSYEVFTSASIGIIVSDDLSREPDDYLRDADAAMYRAKEAGKARYEIFDSETLSSATNSRFFTSRSFRFKRAR
jgi:diguanylate cyclase (GGDEF)-like protein